MDVLARDRDLLERVVPEVGEPGGYRLDELFGGRGACGEADRLVAVEQPVVEGALAVDQRSRCAFELVEEPITRTSVAPSPTIALTASWRFCVA